MKPKVSLTKCDNYEEKQVDKALEKSLSLFGGMEQFIKPGQKVLIKPNILTGSSPESAATTHPSIIAAVIKAVKKFGAIPLVGDSPGFESSQKAAKGSGILKVVNKEGATFIEFNQGNEVEFKEGISCKKIPLVKEILEADVIINIAKLKTHGYSGITAAVKNLFGCIPGLIKSQFHLKYSRKNDFDLMLLDILSFVKPALNIVDAVVAMEGEGGPATGAPRKMNLIIAGPDAVAVDSVCAAITGKQATDFNFLSLAAKHNIGETELNKIEILGEKLKGNICKDFKHISTLGDEMLPPWIPEILLPHLRKTLLDHPRLKKSKCTKCGVCYKICASKAITLKDGSPIFDYSKCIGCFCCQEMCKFEAIKIKKSFVARLLLKLASILKKVF